MLHKSVQSSQELQKGDKMADKSHLLPFGLKKRSLKIIVVTSLVWFLMDMVYILRYRG